ncbi:MAG: hypothetical protein A2428_05990 [Bdellovibrionales bacterium RIFOXYC1_FULL_54_43]|nr:MAG: hypothetical protein A2428_05990 [Bdellovibrionales bacterium RIFOXYC1_FULL_54_43]OFZ83756.1 MAG: hypothetical protein A2603_01650 [Bdellovibrionales bacterium RIFOXYD1_FULL_55_31]
MPILIRNPHSVLAVLDARPEDVLQITIPRSLARSPSGSGQQVQRDAWEQVVRIARKHKIQIVEAASGGLNQQRRAATMGPFDGGREGAAEASVRERQGVSVEELFSGAKERAEGRGLWLALDSLQDPRNVGAIFRVAAFFGVEGILLTQERSAPLSAAVYDVASGGMEYVPFTIQTNLQRAFEVAKESGLWVLGTSEHAHDDFRSIERDRSWLLVLGNEEKGVRRLTAESCDVLCKVSPQGREPKVTSLNVSVAAGIMIAHLSNR